MIFNWRINKIALAILFVLLNSLLVSAQKQTTTFLMQKGINISAWLSQTSVTSGQERLDYFTQKDLKELAALGFDHLRLPVSENQLFDRDGNRNEETFQLIHQTIKWCEMANMRIILDCHDLKSSRDQKPKVGQVSLWDNEQAQEQFLKLWLTFSAEFGKYPNSLLAYEILNEPVAPDVEIWNTVAAKIISALRKLEPNRIILLGSNKFNSVTTFDKLKVPENDPNLILSFHFYHPGLLTHYNVSSYENTEGVNGLKLNYPGRLVSSEQVAQLNEKSKERLKVYNGTYDKEKLEAMLDKVFVKAKETGLRIHCGEFGSNFKYPDLDLQLRWIQDMVAIFKKHHIPYTVWGYRKQFGVFNDDRKVKDQRYLDAIVK